MSTTHEPPRRGDAARERLLNAAIDVFGLFGFDGASTRKLADAAGVNLQAIPYYFGSKEGLYLATAEYLAGLIQAHVAPLRERLRERLSQAEGQAAPIGREEAQALLAEMLEAMAALFVSPRSERWARFLIREQMAPTEAFQRIYGGVMEPTLGVARRLVGILVAADPDTDGVRLRTLALLGGVMVFRVAHAAVLRQLAWDAIGPEEAEHVRRLARTLVADLRPGGAP
ncbi:MULTISPECIES: CerR family C-terminal domain-containing protein [unclassified Chelatococcus]|uniref:CerR family C-terminal domain-containing protein n=1 Tax=unclassified Chelatococcus TaxID=2638111 RepID=UPI0002E3EAA7|nr:MULTISPECIES: CerR family C-terminal domain-containing protein [unclassified Chelatococcus]ALA19990.1 TetR family transcriptional regulator [Chelatococcus sp. CO-6]